jgi:hypothetical protein
VPAALVRSIQSGDPRRSPKKRTGAMPKSIRKQKREADEKPKTEAAPDEQKKRWVKWNPAHDS